MANLSDELSELSHNELQFVIDGFFLWANKTMVQRGISIRGWKAWMGARISFSLQLMCCEEIYCFCISFFYIDSFYVMCVRLQRFQF